MNICGYNFQWMHLQHTSAPGSATIVEDVAEKLSKPEAKGVFLWDVEHCLKSN